METKFRIGNVTLDNHILVGPMAGISNLGFRTMIKRFEPGMIYSEMLSDKAITYHSKKTLLMTAISPEERPLALQLFGHDVDSMVEAAVFLDRETDCDVIDINMGCPVPKVVNNQAGSAMMKDPEHTYEVVRAITAAVEKPVTVKLRAGWDEQHINVVEMASELQHCGISAIAVHPRTRTQYYSGHSDWDLIRQVKEAVTEVPVIGNGDIKSVDDMLEMKRQTNCDAFMVSRGCLGNPWLIQQLVHYEKYQERLEDPTFSEKLQQCLEHADSLCKLKGERIAIKEMRGHACWYINGMPNNNKVKAIINNITTYQQLEDLLRRYDEAMLSGDFRYFTGG